MRTVHRIPAAAESLSKTAGELHARCAFCLNASRGGPDVFVDVLGEHVERHVAAEHHGSLNAFRSNFASERRRRLLALPVDLAVAHLVAARLSRPRAIAIDLAGDFLGVRSVHVDEEPDGLLARPALGVDARVDDQAARPEGNRLQISEAPDAIVVIGAELVGELLGIESPTLPSRR